MKSFIFRTICTGFIFFLFCAHAWGQTSTYPVQVYTQLIPPYTPYAPAYYSGGVEKMRVTLINTDMQQPTLDVYLRMKITSSIFSMQTPDRVYMPPLTLYAGIPVVLSLNDLEPYFRRENLSISGGQSEFYRTQMLPDNFYRFHFEVYEVNTNRLLSNTRVGFAQALIAAGNPPVLNLPLKGSVIEESNIPNIMFTWTPRHFNSVAAAYGTEYEISIVEIYDKQTSAENAFQYSRVLYSERTRSTSFIYTSAQPFLQPGLRYGWRVQAIAREGLEDAQVFKNNGYSEIFWFDYKGNCPAVTTSGVVIKGLEATVSWQPTQAIDYTLEYRKTGSKRWYPADVSGTSGTLYGLQWGETYEYRIGSRCYANDLYDYSITKAFTMPDKSERNPNCGILADASITNRTPVMELIPGLPVFAGDFPIFITEVHGSGVFSGTGYVGIPFTKLPKITVTFSNITVNTDHRLIDGFFETKYDINNGNMLWDVDQTLTGGGGVGDIRTGEERAQFVVNYTINPDIQVKPAVGEDGKYETNEDGTYAFTKNENGKYVFILTDSEGNEHRIESDTVPVTITDNGGGADGKTYLIDEHGNITPISANSNIVLNEATKDKPRPDIATLAFDATTNTKYAVDQYKEVYSKVTEYFLKYKPEGESMVVSAKFMVPGASDEIFVRIVENKSLNPEKVHFVTGKGKEYSAIYDAVKQGWTLMLLGSDADDGQNLYVVQEENPGQYVTLARLNIYSYTPQTIKVRLVPVNGFTNGFTKASVEQQLNAIYNKVGITCEVEISSDFDYEPLKNNTFNVTGSGLFSTLTADMKAINNAYMQTADYKQDAITLFIIENVTGADGVAGDMPRGKQFGYLFNGADSKTIAHEVGHGIFHLDHPFYRANAAKSFDKGDLDGNVMEYPPFMGEQFVKLQWDAIHSPGLVIGLFERDEEGMAVTGDYYGQKIVRPDGKSEWIHSEAVCVLDEKEQVIAFLLPDEKIFYWVKNQTATGYFQEGGISNRYSYGWYVEDKLNRKTQPISWGIYLAMYDLGQFAIDFGTSPLETTTNFANGIWKIATLQFDIEKTWNRIINADLTDASYVVSTVLICQLAGPKGKRLIVENDVPRFGEFLGEVTATAATRGSKMTWPQLLVLFQKARAFEATISQYLIKLYPAEQGYKVFRQVYLKVDGVTSIADDLIYNTKADRFILNETKYGTSNTLRKNQNILQDAIKQGKEIEIRSAQGIEGTKYKLSSKIKIDEIIHSHSIDGTITNNTVQAVWKK